MSGREYKQYTKARRTHWSKIAEKMDSWQGWGGYYHRRMEEIYCFLVPPGLKVLEIGCGQGDLLSNLKPCVGVGVDFCHEMLLHAIKKHPWLHFYQGDAHYLAINGTFDVIIISDLLNDLWDVQYFFEGLKKITHAHTRIIINTYSRLWEIPLRLAEMFNLAKPVLKQNWLTVPDVINMLNLVDFQAIRAWPEIIWPFYTPLVVNFINKILVRFWPFSLLALTNMIVARPQINDSKKDFHVSVIIPARNEAGTIHNILNNIPRMGSKLEVIFVEGGSHDETVKEIEKEIQSHVELPAQLIRQTGLGKAEAIRQGFEVASGDVLIILDADLTVPPEELPRFYDAISANKGEFINGVRLVYPRENLAMPYLNLIVNKLFCGLFSWLLGQDLKDTLCGTKALWKNDYKQISKFQAQWGASDPFGDFNLLLGASRLNLKIVDMPIHYRQRIYGKSNINRWQHGWMLLKMAWLAAIRLKFK